MEHNPLKLSRRKKNPPRGLNDMDGERFAVAVQRITTGPMIEVLVHWDTVLRLQRVMGELNKDPKSENYNPSSRQDLGTILMSAAHRGLEVWEHEDRVQATIDGHFITYPRRRQALDHVRWAASRLRRAVKAKIEARHA